jgi:hypothetical protein
MNAAPDDRPVMGLEHLAIPNVSASQDWLKRQGEQREAARTLVRDIAKQFFPALPDHLVETFAIHVVAELDHRA